MGGIVGSADRSSSALAVVVPLDRDCRRDDQCGADKACVDERCLCANGLFACGDACRDLASDAEACGGCDVRCAQGESCQAGTCVSPEVAAAGEQLAIESLGPIADPPVQISGGDPTTTCTYPHTEGYPQRSQSGGPEQLFLGYNDMHFNATNGWNGWPVGAANPPRGATVAPNRIVWGDAWTTTSGRTGLEYFSYILDSDDPQQPGVCVGIGAATWNQLVNDLDWQEPVDCANPLNSDVDDGPAMAYDQSGSDLWVVSSKLPAGGNVVCGGYNGPDAMVCLDLYRSCAGDRPGEPGGRCPRFRSTPVHPHFTGHATVAVIQPTHDAVVAWRGGVSKDEITLRFFDPSGLPFNTWTLATGQAMGKTSSCEASQGGCTIGNFPGFVPKCGNQCSGLSCGEPSCMRITSKVHVVTTYNAAVGGPLAYVSWDQSCGSPRRYRSKMAVVDLTDERAPRVIRTWISASCGTVTNDFEAAPAANNLGVAGFFHYRQQDADPCQTIFTGRIGTDFGRSALTSVGTIAGPFPTITFENWLGLGDYIGAVKNSCCGFMLYPVWSQPVQATSDQCDSFCCVVGCGGGPRFNLGIFGTRVSP